MTSRLDTDTLNHWRSCTDTIRARAQQSKSRRQLISCILNFWKSMQLAYWCCCFDIHITLQIEYVKNGENKYIPMAVTKMAQTRQCWQWCAPRCWAQGDWHCIRHTLTRDTDTITREIIYFLQSRYPSSRSHACAATSYPAIYPGKKLFREISIICIGEHVAMWPGCPQKKGPNHSAYD